MSQKFVEGKTVRGEERKVGGGRGKERRGEGRRIGEGGGGER